MQLSKSEQRAQSADLSMLTPSSSPLILDEDGPLHIRPGNSPADVGRVPLTQAPLQHATDSAGSGFFAGVQRCIEPLIMEVNI